LLDTINTNKQLKCTSFKKAAHNSVFLENYGISHLCFANKNTYHKLSTLYTEYKWLEYCILDLPDNIVALAPDPEFFGVLSTKTNYDYNLENRNFNFVFVPSKLFVYNLINL
jgi:hypothetical protein